MSTLLRELSNQDIDWLLNNGSLVEIPPHTLLAQPGQPITDCCCVLDGGLSVTVQTEAQTVTDAGAGADARDTQQLEMTRLLGGELFGDLPALSQFLPPALITTLAPTRLLRVPGAQFAEQMECDRTFAAHVYHTATQLLSNRISAIAQRCGYSLGLLSQLQLQESTTVFGALQDADLDWLMAVGQLRQLAPNECLLQRGRPLDQLHIVLDGAVGLSAPQQAQPHMLAAFRWDTGKANPHNSRQPKKLQADQHANRDSANRDSANSETEFTRLSRGSLLGEMMFVETHPPLFTARAVRATQVLSIPRWRLLARLFYEPEFAQRLYQVLAILLANKQQSLLHQLGFGPAVTELSHDRLSNLSLAEARFDWMVKRLHSQVQPV